MNKLTFKNNLIKVIEELTAKSNILLDERFKFVVVPIIENGKKYSSTDDYLRLWLFSENNLKNRYLNFEQVVEMFSGLAPLFPLWINVSVKDSNESTFIVELQTSLRFRKPSQIQNQETGHPPFKAVFKESK